MSVDYENDLLLITCASGKQASRLLPLLYGKWKRLRLVVHSPASEARLKQQYPAADVTRANLENVDETRRIMAGVTTVFHVGPSYHPHETEIGYFMVDAAVEQGTSHFVYSSVLNTQLRKMMNHDCKRYVEEYLMESGLNFSILQPSHFMDMFPLALLLSQSEPVYQANWKTTVPFSFVALQDLAEAAAKVIEEREKHFMAQYPLCSTLPMPYAEVVRVVGQEIGKDIRIETRPVVEAADALLKMLFGSADKAHPRTRDAAHRMVLFYNYHGLQGNPNILEWLIGRKPTSHRDWVRAQVQNAEEAKTG
ncbi:Nucleoside-diphosphate-sugar epimerase [Neofusicoccum parvum]|uniref:NmrA-like domain-containing protein n=1 Tax=Neofusicoccum ribis TaxID=45134 RepID=A0ABR3TDE8_9PEZI|nr:Nucleoside-diphosphate-sugar epimerase [Neofusicoccum parvum]